MIGKKASGKTLSTARIRRKQKRRPRRLIESVQADFDRWDDAAAKNGLNFAELARRSLNNYCFLLDMRREGLAAAIPVVLQPDPVEAGAKRKPAR